MSAWLRRAALCPHLATTLTRDPLRVTCLACGKSRAGVLL